MSRSLTLVVLSLLFDGVASAQIHVDAGLALGLQPYESRADSPRVLSSADVLLRGDAWGVHVAGEYADISQLGAMIALHMNVVYRRTFGDTAFVLAGAGPTHVDLGEFTKKLTWNAEAEVGRRFGRTDVFGRVRHYDYSEPVFRDRPASPSGLAVYLGVRFRLRE